MSKTCMQVTIICERAGVPSSEDIEAVHSQYAKTMMETMVRPNGNPNKLRQMFPDAPADALDLMQKLLQFNPDKRLTAEEALQHPYVSHFHNPDDEPVAPGPITISIDDNKKVSVINAYVANRPPVCETGQECVMPTCAACIASCCKYQLVLCNCQFCM